jgi:Peptidase propeptide and YPEB domain
VEALSSAARSRGRMGGGPWLRAGVIGCVLVLAFVASRTCQRSQIRISKDQAIATAEQQVKYHPTREQVRLVRQGLGSKPFWAVSLSIPTRNGEGFRRLTVVKVDANTGKVASIAGSRR